MIAQSLFGHSLVSVRARTLLLRILAGVFILAVTLGGMQLRRWIGENTRHVRYQHDIVNAFYWGNETLKEARRLSPDERTANSWPAFFRGYLSLYERVKDDAYENDYGLDYPPLRLLIMAIWTKEVRDEFPWVDNEHPKLVNPLLKLNMVCELLSAAAIFAHVCSGHYPRVQRGRLGYRGNSAPPSVVSPLQAWRGSSRPSSSMRMRGRSGTSGSCRSIFSPRSPL